MSTQTHLDTVTELVEPLARAGVRLEPMRFDRFLVARSLPRAGYVLTDFDRVHPWHIEIAGRIAGQIRAAGLPVLNDPVRFVPRAALLRRLHDAGVNDFTCWLPGFGEMPEKFPAFLRTIHAHRGVLSGLLNTPAEAQTVLREAMAGGHVLSDLVFIEYCHPQARARDGQRRKQSCYRIGEAIIPGLTITEFSWPVRHGDRNSASPEDYAADRAELDAYPHKAALARAFDVAGCEFGRADFCVVDGKPQIYEINTNPYIGFAPDHPNADRRETDAEIGRRIVAALAGVARPSTGPRVDLSQLDRGAKAFSGKTIPAP